MIPQRFVIEMINRGWILRNTLIWYKPNCMPSSVRDRFTVDFEYLFFFVKNKKYWFETQFEPLGKDKRMAGIRRARELGYDGKGSYQEWYHKQRKKQSWHDHSKDKEQGFGQQTRGQSHKKPNIPHPQGRNKRCVWKITTKPFKDVHFAVFPEELVETPIKAGCPKGGIILDPFCGSGTTCVVAKKLERNYIGIELNPEYCEMANIRLKNVADNLL